jgi:hypothetical protein
MNSYMGWFWPDAMLPDSGGFNYNLLCASNPAWGPTDKFNDQWFVANIEPCMHYVLAQPGTDQYRIKPNQTGFSNLYFAGDWTDFGLNVGYMEGTVISAMQAAAAILTEHFDVSEDSIKPVKGPVLEEGETGRGNKKKAMSN